MMSLRQLRPRFTLRAVLVAMTLAAAFFTYHINWIQQRRAELIAFKELNVDEKRRGNLDFPGWQELYTSTPFYQSKAKAKLPRMLRLFGENAQTSIVKEWHDESTWLDEHNRLVDLFPEAMVILQIRTTGH